MNSPRILLIRPPESMGLLGSQIIHEPWNLLMLAAVARDKGADVRLADFAVDQDLPKNFKALLKEFDPAVVGFSCMTQDVHAAAEMAAVVKKVLPKAITLAGGIHPSVLPERTLEEFPSFDMCVAGEGEHTLQDIVEALIQGDPLKSIDGTVYRDGDRIVSEKRRPPVMDLDSLPLPARDLAPMDSYLVRTSTPGVAGSVKKVGTLFTARGCPYSCIFCSGSVICGKKPRNVPLENLRQEVGQLVGKYGVGHITIKDDTFTFDTDRTLEVGKILADANVTWDCKTRINHSDPALLREMKAQGCTRVHYGVESGSDRILKQIKKSTTVAQVEQAFAHSKDVGFERTAYFIIGAHPSETYQEFEQSRALCKKLKPEYAVFSVIVPYPGTKLYQIMKEKELIFSEDWRRYNPFVQVPAWRTENFSPEQLMDMQKKAMTGIYLSPYFIASKLKTLRQPSAWGYWAKSAWDFLKYRNSR